jgi:hypothetical protein
MTFQIEFPYNGRMSTAPDLDLDGASKPKPVVLLLGFEDDTDFYEIKVSIRVGNTL